MKSIDEMLHAERVLVQDRGEDGFNGEYFSLSNWRGSIIVSWGLGWEHVSVSPYNHHKIPTWDDMCDIKNLFWRKDEWVMEFHPPEDEYVNQLSNCLHLWKPHNWMFPTPPSFMVGMRKGQTKAEFERELREYVKTWKEEPEKLGMNAPESVKSFTARTQLERIVHGND